MKRIYSDTGNRMTDEACMPAYVCLTRKIMRTLTSQPKQRKKTVLLICWWFVYLFASRKSIFWVASKQTELKIYPRIKNCVRRAAKIKFIRTEN